MLDRYEEARDWAVEQWSKAIEDALVAFGPGAKRSPQEQGAATPDAIYDLAAALPLDEMDDGMLAQAALEMGQSIEHMKQAREIRLRAVLRLRGASERLPEPQGVDDAGS